MKILIRLSFISILFCYFDYNKFVSDINFSSSGYANIYAINRISDSELIKLPFRLISYDLGFNYNDYSFNINWGLEHKIKTLNSKQPLNSFLFDLISKSNVDFFNKNIK